MGWAFFYMFVVLKIPVALALWLIWWAVHQDPATDDEEHAEGGDGRGGPRHPRPQRPRAPRRGSHAGGQMRPPQRVRARSRRVAEPAHR